MISYKGILNARFVRKLLDRNRKLRPWRFDKKMDKLQDLVDRLAAAVLDLNRRVADLSVTLVALLELLHDANVLTSEEFESYQASVALRTSGLKSFNVD